jgi:hypothetical protein
LGCYLLLAIYATMLATAGKGDRHLLPERPEGCCAQKVPVTFSGAAPTIARQPAFSFNPWWTTTRGDDR